MFPTLVRIRKALLATALMLALLLFGLDRYAAMVHRPAEGATAVVLYTTAWCPYCTKLRQGLRASHIPFTEHDVETSLDGQLGMWALRGRGVPVAVIGSRVVYGYRVDEIAAALKALGYTFTPAAETARPQA